MIIHTAWLSRDIDPLIPGGIEVGIDKICVTGRKLPGCRHANERQSGQDIYDSLYNAHFKK